MTSDDFGSYVEKNGFHRDTNYIPTRITADGRDGYPVEAGRYRLVVFGFAMLGAGAAVSSARRHGWRKAVGF